jgi:serine/threonine protein kinase
VNGGINKVKQEHVCELQDRNSQRLIDILKEAGRNFNQKDKYKQARLYNMKGLEILDEDVQFMKHNDVFYVAFDGEEFNNCALLDEYEIGAVLGEGGYGKVVLAKHISTKRKVAIKFMDI